MIPRADVRVSATLPRAATFWMPAESDMDGEGIGFFQDVWSIYDVPLSEAALVVASELAAATAIDKATTTRAMFEHFAQIIETHNPDFPSDEPDAVAAMATLAQHGEVDSVSLCSLELGVAGLTHALAAIGCVPAASCRSHAEYSWADRPVVVAAIDREHAAWLQPLVERSYCGFAIDQNRPAFLTIDAPSITEMIALATAIVAEADRNPPPPLHWGPSADGQVLPESGVEVDGQQSLFG